VRIEAPRGTADVLPVDQPARDAIVRSVESAAQRYGYGRITTPVFEDTELFARTSGQGSDVVTKEMYTFQDRAGRSLTLRPEATASVARAYIEHGLHRAPQPVKTYYLGPMFRYAAPQKGRYREFWQFGFEAMGSDDPALDAELIQLFLEIVSSIGIEGLRLELNSIGDRECRPRYVQRLRAYLAEHDAELDEDARRKATVSPLRVFDTKNPAVRRALEGAPTIGESLCGACREHFRQVLAFLEAYEVDYVLVPTLVRGLDYYTRTVFEFANDALEAAQSTVCAGGRYDYLIEEIGGPPTAGVGWAAGIERLAMSLSVEPAPGGIDVFFVCGEDADRPRVLAQMTKLRAAGLSCDTDYAGRSLKGQMTHAGRLRAGRIVRVSADAAVIRMDGVDLPDPVPIDEIAATLLR
jgi:histidyl-tRNA synthetase